MSSPATTSERPGPRRVGCSTPWIQRSSMRRSSCWARASPWANSACCRCTAVDRNDLEVSPNLWAGIGLVRPGAGTALVGSHEQVAERIFEYHELGIDEFILSGSPAPRGGLRRGRGRAPSSRARPMRPAEEPVHAWGARRPDVRVLGRPLNEKRRRDRSIQLHLAVALDGAGWHPAAWREPDVDPTNFFRPGTGPTWSRKPSRAARLRHSRGFTGSCSRRSPHPRRAYRPGAGPTRRCAYGGKDRPLHLGHRHYAGRHHHPHRAVPRLQGHRHAGLRERRARRVPGAHLPYRTRGGPVRTAQLGPNPPERRDVAGGSSGSDLFDEAVDFVEVVAPPWDSWEDDAEIRDVATGRFIDRDKLHYIDFEGRWFSVKGPSITPRPPQGQPLVMCWPTLTSPSDWPPERRSGVRHADDRRMTPDRWWHPRDHSDAGAVRTSPCVSSPTWWSFSTTIPPRRGSAKTSSTTLTAGPALRCVCLRRHSRRTRRPPGGVAPSRHRWVPTPSGRTPPRLRGHHPRSGRLTLADQFVRPVLQDLHVAGPAGAGSAGQSVRIGMTEAQVAERTCSRSTWRRTFPGQQHHGLERPAAGSHIEFSSFVKLAQTAERAKFDFFFLAEGLRLREQRGRSTISTWSVGPTRSPSWPPWPR